MRPSLTHMRSTLRLLKGWHLLFVAAFVLSASVGFAALLYGHTAAFATPSIDCPTIDLGTAKNFAVLGGSTVTSTGFTAVTGDLGVWPGLAITGFGPGTVTGTIHAGDAVAMQAQSDVTAAYNALAGKPCNTSLTGQDLGGQTLPPGVYCFSSSAGLTGTLTLDGQGDPNAVFIFQIGTTLTTASSSAVLMINGAQNCNVFWQVGSSATLGTGTAFVGNILALASVTLNTGASLSGRALARNGAVTLDFNVVAVANCAPLVPPTLSKAFNPATINAGGVSTLTITLINPNTLPATLTAPLTDTLPLGVVIAPTPMASTTCGGSGAVAATAGGTMVTLPVGRSIPGGTPGTCTITVNVTAALSGSYLNTLPAGALQTCAGNNAAPASATLIVVPASGPPLLSKAFNPVTINEGGVSTLTITLINPNAIPAILAAPLTDTLPLGVVIAPIPSASTTCPGSGAVAATAGGTTVTLPVGRSIPGGTPGTCTITVNVTAALAGNYINTLPMNALQTTLGNNADPAIATLTVIAVPLIAPSLSKAFSPATINAGSVSTLTITLSNPSLTPAALTAPLTDTLPAGVVIAAIPNASTTCPGSGAVAATAGGTTVTLPVGRSIPAGSGAMAGTCTVTVNVTAALEGSYLNTLPAGALQTSNGNNAAVAIATLIVVQIPDISDQKTGSVLFYNIYTSNTADLTRQNTRINLTNTNPARSIAVHLFFVDGSTCTPADSFICLTPNQTVSVLASDVDPGTTGYIVAVASDPITGCPVNFNFLIGDEFVKFSSGHQANLGAEAFAAIALTLPCGAGTATLNFDGVSYNQVPRVLAVDNFPSPADGNNTLLILNRFGGDLASGASTIGALFGVLYDEAEQPFSFTLSSNTCQLRGSLNNSFLRTTQRLETVISAGRSGWLRLWGVNNIGLLGSVINFNATAGVNNFSQGHNLHKLTFTSVSLTIPIIVPAC